VVKDGEVVFARGYGVRSLDAPDEVTTQTLFAIGSTTKAMTAAALGMLVDEGKLRWNDPVTQHLPWFELSDPWVTREITVRDLLTHRAGLGNADFLWYEQENSTAEILRRVRLVEPAYSMRAGFIYQNIMYATAGEVVAAVSGIPWEEFIQTRILDPLAMTGTIATAARLYEQPDFAMPHYLIDDTVRVIENASVDAVAAAGSVWSSVDEMALWVEMLLDDGETNDGARLLRSSTIRELFTPQAIIRSGFYPTARLTNPHWTTYGMGWFQADYRGRAVDFHTGSIDGMVAIVGLIRDESLGVCVLANLDHAEVRHALMYRVFDVYDEGEPRDWSAELMELYSGIRAQGEAARSRVEEERVEGTSPSVELDRLVGTYSDPLRGTVVIRLDNGELRLEYGPGLRGPLSHWNYDTFRVSWDAAWRGTAFVSFILGRTGKPVAIEFRGARFERERAEAG
jgi:CubicO group peptidase (beta-lactamase class C family)